MYGKHVETWGCTEVQFHWVPRVKEKYWEKPFASINVKNTFHSRVRSTNIYWTSIIWKSLVLKAKLVKNIAIVQWKKNRKNYTKLNTKLSLYLNTDNIFFAIYTNHNVVYQISNHNVGYLKLIKCYIHYTYRKTFSFENNQKQDNHETQSWFSLLLSSEVNQPKGLFV